jgi:mRNA interferase RelE/StbE
MYKILYKKSVEKDLRKLAITQRKIIIAKIQALADNPHPIGATKLRGSSDLFRMRHTDYRIIYQINDSELIIMIVKVGHRREVYRDL